MGHWIDITTSHGPVAGWKVDGPEKPRGAIAVIQEIFGVNGHVRSLAEGFAEQGYATLAPAYFDLIERGVELGYDAPGIAKGRALITRLGLEQAADVTAAAAQALQACGPVGTVGYCWGGTVALLAAQRLGLPSVSYYGARNLPFLDEAPKAPLQFHFGGEDPSIPPEAVHAHCDKLGEVADVFEYPGAGHAFNREIDPAHYHAGAAREAHARTMALFDEALA